MSGIVMVLLVGCFGGQEEEAPTGGLALKGLEGLSGGMVDQPKGLVYMISGVEGQDCLDLSNSDVAVRMETLCWRLTTAGCYVKPKNASEGGGFGCECAGAPVQVTEDLCSGGAYVAAKVSIEE